VTQPNKHIFFFMSVEVKVCVEHARYTNEIDKFSQ
jgi:hypothetical protein